MSLWLEEKNTFKKNISIGFCRITRVTDRPSFAGFLLSPVFYLTRIDPAIKLTRFQIDPSGQSDFNKYDRTS
jgi:hypothetical protein